VKRHYYWGTAP